MRIYCAINQFPELQSLGFYNKTHGVLGLGKNYHLRFDPKLGNDTFAIRRIPCDCTPCTSILGQPWIPGMTAHQKPCYQPVKYCTYWPVLGYFRNWNILKLSHNSKSSE